MGQTLAAENLKPPDMSREALASFEGIVLQALKAFQDPIWLGEHSPLAAPYFLGEYLQKQAQPERHQPQIRGQALQKLLEERASILADQEATFIRHAFFEAQSLDNLLYDELHISRATFFRRQKQAVQRLAKAIVRQLKPALRLETPIPAPELYGRRADIQTGLSLLKNGQTLGLTGPSGVGKTALGVHIASVFSNQPFFWFTFRPGLNDTLSSLLFSLGYFLHQCGKDSLWLQLVTDEGQVNLEVTPWLVRHDLTGDVSTPLLLCFDEVDLLRPTEIEAHKQIASFLESLSGTVPMIFIGQYLPLKSDYQQVLSGLEQSAIKQLLKLNIPQKSLKQLTDYTQGNPRLLKLFADLYHSGEPLKTLLEEISTAPSLEFLLNRIWQCLDEDEKRFLVTLAVFRRPAPRDAWSQEPELTALEHLLERHLAQSDGRGGITLLPSFRDVIYRKLSQKDRERLHIQAAFIRAERGDYTASAHHYVAGNDPRTAVWLWYPHMQQEINQGQAEAALNLFSQVSPTDLVMEEEQELLRLIQAELQKLLGNHRQAKEILTADPDIWRSPYLRSRAKRLEGDLAEASSDYEHAHTVYQEGLDYLEQTLPSEMTYFHRDLGWIHMRQKNLDQAWREALLARYEIENLQGNIEVERGNLAEAGRHFHQALEIAKELNHDEGTAKTSNNLATLLARQQQFEAAELHWQEASEHYKRIGKRDYLAGVKVNLAFLYNRSGHYKAAIETALEALTLFTEFNQSYGLAVAAQNLAEAFLALGELDEAEKFARQVIQTKEKSTRPDGLRVLGEVRLAQREFEQAESYIKQSISAAQTNEDPYLEAYARRTLGELYRIQGKQKQANEASKQAIKLFKDLGLDHEVEETKRKQADS